MIGQSIAWVAEEQEHKRMKQLFGPALTFVTPLHNLYPFDIAMTVPRS